MAWYSGEHGLTDKYPGKAEFLVAVTLDDLLYAACETCDTQYQEETMSQLIKKMDAHTTTDHTKVIRNNPTKGKAMTTITDTTDTTNTTQDESTSTEPTADAPTGLSPADVQEILSKQNAMFQTMWHATLEAITSANAAGAALKAAKGDPDAARESAWETPEADSPLAKLRADYDKLMDAAQKIRDKADPMIKDIVAKAMSSGESDIPKLEKTFSEATALRKSAVGMVKTLAEQAGIPEILDALPNVERVKKSVTGRTNAGDASSRIRGYDWFVNGKRATTTTKNSEGVEVIRSNTAAAARILGVESSLLQEQFRAAAGNENGGKPATVEFTFRVGAGDSAVDHKIRAVRTAVDSDGESNATADAA